MKRVEEDGRVVAVLEKRAINAQREGYFIVQVDCEHVKGTYLDDVMQRVIFENIVCSVNQANSRQLFWAGWPSSTPPWQSSVVVAIIFILR